jgi:quinol monooxygenase YgiN
LTILWTSVESSTADRRELTQALLNWVATVRREAGLVRVQVSEDMESPGAYLLVSAWRTRKDLEAHLVGSEFGILLGALEVLGLQTQLNLTDSGPGSDDAVELVGRLRGHMPALVRRSSTTEVPVIDPPKAGGLAWNSEC